MLNLKSQQLFQLRKLFQALFDLQQTPCTCQGHIKPTSPLGKASAVHVVGGGGGKENITHTHRHCRAACVHSGPPPVRSWA